MENAEKNLGYYSLFLFLDGSQTRLGLEKYAFVFDIQRFFLAGIPARLGLERKKLAQSIL
jgi:hypothetical protein